MSTYAYSPVSPLSSYDDAPYLTAVVSTVATKCGTMREVRVRFAGDSRSFHAGLIRHVDRGGNRGDWEAEGLVYGHEQGAACLVARRCLSDLGWCSCEVVATWWSSPDIHPGVMRDIQRGHQSDKRDGITICRSR